jgi:endonuclease G, mitochondrial
MKNASMAALPLVLALLGGTVLTPPDQSQHRTRIRLAHASVFSSSAAPLSPEDEALAEEDCPFGLPAKDPAFELGPTVLVARRGYALEHSSVDKIPLWVCEHVEKDELQGTADRRDNFKPDPKLAKGQRSELADYSGSGFDRGHMAPAGDQKKSQVINDETFFLSNMAPQVGIGFNRDIWAGLEDLTRSWVQNGAVSAAFIITGPIFFDPQEEDPATADGLIEHQVIGTDAVSVPTHFYKIVVGQTADGQYKAVAFVLENKKYTGTPDFKTFIKSIDWIEQRTGLNFMPMLDQATEQRLEKEPGQLF